MPRFDVITFDCYGTLIDWETGIRKAFLAGAAAAGVTLPPEKVLPAYAEIEPRIEEQAYRPYREVLARTAVGVAERLGWRLALETRALPPREPLVLARRFPTRTRRSRGSRRPAAGSASSRTWTTISSRERGGTSPSRSLPS